MTNRTLSIAAAALSAAAFSAYAATAFILPPAPATNHIPTAAANDTLTSTARNIEPADTVIAKGKGNTSFNDSAAFTLPETTVVADNEMHTPGKSIYIPSKSQKNTAVDAMALLERMNIPQLLPSPSGGFSASDGSPVSYFINGRPAAQEELTGMNMSDVKKVEYLDFPSEANFMGSPHVLNFIVQEYLWGGYTRVGLNHYYFGGYSLGESIFSRWNQGNMTYDLSLAPQNDRVDPEYVTSTDVFKFAEGTVERFKKPVSGRSSSGTYPVKLRAVYYKGPAYISNSLGYSFADTRHNSSEGTVSYSGFPSAGHAFRSEAPRRVNSLTWDGYGGFDLAKGWSLSTQGNVSYSHYNLRNRYTLFGDNDLSGDPVSDIRNYVKENAIDGSLKATAGKTFSPVHSVNINAMGFMHNSRMRYLESGHKSRFSSNAFALNGQYTFRKNKIYLNTTLGVAHEHASMDGDVVNTLYPYGTVSFNYAFSNRHNLNLWMQYSTFSPDISLKNPVTVQRDELMYVEGNPAVKPFPRFETNINHLFFLGFLRVYTMFNYNHAFNTVHTVYSPMPGKQAMLETYVNGGHTDDVSLRINMSTRILDDKIMLTLTPEYRIQTPSYPGYPTLRHFEVFPTVNGYFGNFYFNVRFYSGKSRKYNSQNMDLIIVRPHRYWLTAGWGNGKVRAEVNIINIFTKKTDSYRDMYVTPSYDSTSIYTCNEGCRRIQLSLSYTFGYGKKIDSYDELREGVTNSASGVKL